MLIAIVGLENASEHAYPRPWKVMRYFAAENMAVPRTRPMQRGPAQVETSTDNILLLQTHTQYDRPVSYNDEENGEGESHDVT